MIKSMEPHKKCSKCKIEKPIKDFYKNKRYKYGVYHQCKKCTIKKTKEWYKKNPKRALERTKKWARENREKVNVGQRRWAHKNKDKILKYKNKWIAKNPDKERNRRLVYNNGITLEEFNKMLNEQGGVCAICGSVSIGKRLCVDHSHSTGKIRGLLCDQCNKGLGHFRDNIDYLLAGIKYLSL